MSLRDEIAQVLGRHYLVSTDDMVALCSCGTGGEVSALSEVVPWHDRHQADAVIAHLALTEETRRHHHLIESLDGEMGAFPRDTTQRRYVTPWEDA